MSGAIDRSLELAARAAEARRPPSRPVVVAVDGPSGAGKSTFAAALAARLGGVAIDGDDFFAGGAQLRGDSPADRARDCIDWRRQRPVLEALRAGRPAAWLAFDWEAVDGRLRRSPSQRSPAAAVVLEGVYSARPELADLLDLRILLWPRPEVARARLLRREGSIGSWELQWHEAEAHYFSAVAPPSSFDLVLDGS